MPFFARSFFVPDLFCVLCIGLCLSFFVSARCAKKKKKQLVESSIPEFISQLLTAGESVTVVALTKRTFNKNDKRNSALIEAMLQLGLHWSQLSIGQSAPAILSNSGEIKNKLFCTYMCVYVCRCGCEKNQFIKNNKYEILFICTVFKKKVVSATPSGTVIWASNNNKGAAILEFLQLNIFFARFFFLRFYSLHNENRCKWKNECADLYMCVCVCFCLTFSLCLFASLVSPPQKKKRKSGLADQNAPLRLVLVDNKKKNLEEALRTVNSSHKEKCFQDYGSVCLLGVYYRFSF